MEVDIKVENILTYFPSCNFLFLSFFLKGRVMGKWRWFMWQWFMCPWLKGRGGIAQSEWHTSAGEGTKQTCERHLLLIVEMNSDLIITRISNEKSEVT